MGTLQEKKQLQQKSNVLVGIAFATFIGWIAMGMLFKDNALAGVCALLMALAGLVTWFGGLMAYAKSKGYSSLVGLLGFIGIFGLLILLVLPDQWKLSAPPVVDPNSNYPRNPNRW